jgi:TetR/AcrR family transcriptional regulator
MLLSNLSCSKALPRVKHARRKEARPGELLAAALELFVEKGYSATRVEEVAKRAGVSKGTLFLYFPSKEELFKAVVREALANRFPEWNAEFATWPGTTPEMLRYAMQQWWERVGRTPVAGIIKLMISEATNFPELAAFYEREVIAPGHTLVGRILQRGIDRGEFRAMNIEHATYAVLAPMMFLCTWQQSFGACAPIAQVLPPIDPVQYLTQQADILLHGLCAPAPSSPHSRARAS